MENTKNSRKLGFFGRLKRLFKNDLSLTDEKAWSPSGWNLAGAQTKSGVAVTEETALTYSAVYNATSLIAGTISTLPLKLFIEKDNKKQVATEKTIHQALNTRWNKYMTAQIGREVLTAHVLLWGNGYCEILRNKMGQITELWPIAPNRVRPEMVDNELTYLIDTDNGQLRETRRNILHIPGLGFDGFVGYSVIAMARESIGLSMATEQFGSQFFGNGTHPGVIVSHPGKLGEQASKNLNNSLVSTYSGLGQAHKLLLLEEGMSMTAIGIPPEDAQFLQTRAFQVPEIARFFNLPPHKLKDLTKSSFNNIESEQISFVTDSILPWAIRFETNYNAQLLTETENKAGYYFKHILDGLLRGDSKTRAEFYGKMFNIGAMSINEIRSFEELDPISDGDRYFVPMNMVPLDKIDEEPVENVNQTQQPFEQKEEQPGIEQKSKRRNLISL